METIGAIFSESILVSLLGLSIVFIALVAISL
ncbi:Na+-transporting methylmalonyl-CoA/oxaloacetate decarboxylase gamma subunit, partial [Fusobacterium sp. PH5-44]